ncbi:MAG TPA: hypothetical protein VN426_12935 [Syntrophomonadaceae bacterium]|nr:hypothetical protein [Syntrophomonadaceae bacterium]
MKMRNILSNPKSSRYMLPMLVVIVLFDIFLGSSGIISREQMKYFLWVPAVLELTVITLCLMNITRITRRYRALKKDGWETMDAWQQALEIILPPNLARLSLIEPRLYYALYKSYKRKRDIRSTVEYATLLDSYIFFVKVIIVICALEILAVSTLLPQRWLIWKAVHMILGLWAILWLWADVRAMGLYGHQITGEGIQFRVGLRCCQQISWEYIANINRTGKVPPGFGPRMVKNQPGCLYLAAGQNCNIEIELKSPRSVQGMFNDMKDVTHLYLSLEKPEEFMKAVAAEGRL